MSTAQVVQYEVAEIPLGPAADASLSADVTFVDPDGGELRLPAFASRSEWRVRYSSERLGVHHYRAEVAGDVPLAHAEGSLEVLAGNDPRALRSHGPIRVARDQRHLEHADGTPFLWLADTWWYGFAERLSATEFRELAALRAQQGFSVVQIVAGLYPETVPFSPESRSESGWVWHEGFTEPNSEWFDEADRRLRELVDQDLVPCVVGSWAHYLRFMDTSQLIRHWRELIARWAAFPVVWCLVGEPPGPWIDESLEPQLNDKATVASTTEEALATMMADLRPALADRVERLNEVASAVRALDGYQRPISIHSIPGVPPWQFLEDENAVDFWLLQTGHQGARSLEPSIDAVHEALERRPAKPVINGEACYEGIAGSSWQEIQRFLFWSHLLSGTAGHSYGAHGIWAFNTDEFPGFYSGYAPRWQEAAEFPGAGQVGLGRRLLMDLPWTAFEPRPDWVEPHQDADDRCLPYAAGVPAGVRVLYFPGQAIVRNQLSLSTVRLRELGGQRWRADLVDPRTGAVDTTFTIDPGPDGETQLHCGYRGWSALPSWDDWLLVLSPAAD